MILLIRFGGIIEKRMYIEDELFKEPAFECTFLIVFLLLFHLKLDSDLVLSYRYKKMGMLNVEEEFQF